MIDLFTVLRVFALGFLLAGPLSPVQARQDGGHQLDSAWVGQGLTAKAAGNPVVAISVGPVNNGWQAHFELGLAPDELRLTLNGKQARHLVKIVKPGTDRVWLAPDDGLRYGRNVLKVTAIYQGRTYQTQAVVFKVNRKQPLASGGWDQAVRVFTPVKLDARRSRTPSGRKQFEWSIAKSPAGSKLAARQGQSARWSFIPDVPGTYEIGLTVRDPKTGAVGRDLVTVPVNPNYPPIGVGIETMATQADGSYAIVVGTNCTAEIQGCPGQIQTFPYGEYPVQLVILDRATLEPLWVSGYKGNYGDAYNVGLAIAGQIKPDYANPIVILAALPGALPIDNDEWQKTLQTYVVAGTKTSPWQGFNISEGGWSAVGVAVSPGASGPTGYLNTGGATVEQANLKGYLQYVDIQLQSQSRSITGYNFVMGDYAGFNTSASQTPTSNTMLINGETYGANLSGGCTGGFQLVVLNASSLQPETAINPNQTFSTNCNNVDPTDQINALANQLNNLSAAAEPVLVFLQSIGAPIDASQLPALATAAKTLSVPIENLGGIADVFNTSINMSSGTPGYALAGGSALHADTPAASQLGVYALEASGSAPGNVASLGGLLKRNHLWRFVPSAGAGGLTTNLSDLPVLLFQAPVPWPDSSSPDEQAALICISNALNLSYADGCYQPAYDNVRAAYCDSQYNTNLLQVRSLSKSQCSANSSWSKVASQIEREAAWLSSMYPAIQSYQNLYQSEVNNSSFDIENIVNKVVTNVEKAVKTDQPVIGSWLNILADGLDAVGYLSGIINATVGKIFLALAAIVEMTPDIMVYLDGDDGLGQIVKTDGQQLASELYDRYYAASLAMNNFYKVLVSDYGKIEKGADVLIEANQAGTISLMQASIESFVYARLLGAVYTAYGLLPTNLNYPSPGSPNNYQCQQEDFSSTPFKTEPDSQGFSWIPFTFQNWVNSDDPPPPVPTLPAYADNNSRALPGAPWFLVMAYYDKGFFSSGYKIMPASLTQVVFAPWANGGTGLGAWQPWFYRHNFKQTGWACGD